MVSGISSQWLVARLDQWITKSVQCIFVAVGAWRILQSVWACRGALRLFFLVLSVLCATPRSVFLRGWSVSSSLALASSFLGFLVCFCLDFLVSCFAAVRASFPASRSLFGALLLFPSRLFVGSVARPIECIAAVVRDAARPHPSLSVDIRTATDSEKTERKK